MNATYKHDMKEIRISLEDALYEAAAALQDSAPNSHERAVMMYVKPQLEKLLDIVNKELQSNKN